MKQIEFLNKILKCSSDKEKMKSFFYENKSIDVEEPDEESVKSFLNTIDESKITDFGNKLYILSNICFTEKSSAEKYGGNEFATQAQTFLTNIKKIMSIYDNLLSSCNESKKKNTPKNMGSGEQGDVHRALVEINSLKGQINSTKDAFEDRSLSILTNNISILGIFVAIAFAGFGVMSIFPEISISYAMESRLALIKTTFFLILTALLVYNLLLLLCYFIFKLTQAFGIKQDNKFSFLGTISLKPFYWIDGVLFALTIASFIASLCNIS